MELFKNNRWLLIPILSSLLLLVLMKTVLFVGYVPTESMEPTLKKDSFILGTRLYGDLTDGDIIIFERDGRLLVKRITASGGEAVVRNGITLIDFVKTTQAMKRVSGLIVTHPWRISISNPTSARHIR